MQKLLENLAHKNMDNTFGTLLLLIVPLASGICPNDWNNSESLCYKVSPDSMTWYNARVVKKTQFILFKGFTLSLDRKLIVLLLVLH